MLARKHLEGRPFEEAAADPALPVMTLRFGPRSPTAGDDAEAGRVTLVLEWTGHASTVALLLEREGAPRVLGLLRPLPRAQRDLAPGAAWTPPVRPGRIDPHTATAVDLEATIARVWARSPRGGAHQFLSRAFDGIGRRVAAEALRRAGIDPEAPPAAIAGEAAASCLSAVREILDAPCVPTVVLDDQGEPVDILPGPFSGQDVRTQPASSISEALERIHARRGRTVRMEATRADINRAFLKQIGHRRIKLARQREDLAEALGGSQWRVLADLLLAQENARRRGGASIEVTDLHDPALSRVTIVLDPALTLAENAARLYRRAKKCARAVAILSSLISRGEEEVGLLEENLAHAQTAVDIDTLETIAHQAAADPKLAAKQGPRKAVPRSPAKQGRSSPGKPPDPVEGPRRFVVEGWEIIAGRHSRDNDRIVTLWGRPDDLWFHARNNPGAHVLLRNPSRIQPPAAIVEAAAGIAAHYSPAREEKNVDVTVAPLRHVRKRRGLAAGQVEVIGGRTVRVRPGLPGPEPRSPGRKTDP
jgi:predicted ribosome quality control (RQC) complex YloA/Tae2 family protein